MRWPSCECWASNLLQLYASAAPTCYVEMRWSWACACHSQNKIGFVCVNSITPKQNRGLASKIPDHMRRTTPL